MDNKVTKERLNNHLEYDWFKYVLILIVSIFLCIFVFNQINALRKFEEINIFAACYEYKINTFGADTVKALSDSGDDTVLEININNQNQRGDDFITLLQTQGAVTSDIIIIGKAYTQGFESFVEWTDEVIDMCVPQDLRESAEFLTGESDRKYALRIDTLKNISDIFGFNPGEIPSPVPEGSEGDYDTEFYVVINPSSNNVGSYSISKKTDPNNVQAFKTVRRLLEVYG